jgi:acetylornithine deacetylase/succinyl-diaminopimelate desuccinylase-like protein
MTRSFSKLIQEIDREKKEWLEKITHMREMILSNIVMLSHTPAQTFHEKERAGLVFDRFTEIGLDTKSDEIDNVISMFPGKEGAKRVLLFAHMDHQFSQNADQNVTITDEKAQGTGVANDTTGLAVLMTLPDIIKQLGMEFDNDIVFTATTRAHGKGNFEGMRTFVMNNHKNIDYAINIGGITLGKVDYFSLSRARCDITVEASDIHGSKAWGAYGQASAVRVMGEILNQMYSIPIPRSPRTVLNIGMISGGEAYSTVSSEAHAGFEILSEDDQTTQELMQEIDDRCADLEARYRVTIGLNVFGQHQAAGLNYAHPMVKSAISIVEDLNVEPLMEYSTSEISIPLAQGIPSLHIGITTGKRRNNPRSYIDLGPLPTGILQIIMLLYAIDKGYCDEEAK